MLIEYLTIVIIKGNGVLDPKVAKAVASIKRIGLQPTIWYGAKGMVVDLRKL